MVSLVFNGPPTWTISQYCGWFVGAFFLLFSFNNSDLSAPFKAVLNMAIATIAGFIKGTIGSLIPSFLFVRLYPLLGFTVSQPIMLIVAASLSTLSVYLSFKVPS
ncbi:hypothetical protein RCL1_000782 [Eukaryota sp. TZLM3-RCL]